MHRERSQGPDVMMSGCFKAFIIINMTLERWVAVIMGVFTA